MQEERKMILTMLEKGTITADEAIKLLQAINEQTASYSDNKERLPEGIKEASQDMRKAMREATQASKEVLKEVREGVKSALRESRRTLQMHRNQKHWQECFDKVSEQNPELAKKWAKAEDDFDEAKKMMLDVSILEDKIANLKKEQEQVLNEEQKKEIALQIDEVQIEKDRLLKSAQELASQAEKSLLSVRRQCREEGFLGDGGAESNRDSDGNIDQVNDIVSNITKQIGPMINQVLGNMSFGAGNSGVEVVDEITGRFADKSMPATVNFSVQNGSIRIYGYDQDDVRVILRKQIRRIEKSKVKEVAERLVQVDFDDNVLNIEVKRHFASRHVVKIEVYLPRQIYNFNLKSLNGKIFMQNVQGGKWLLSTVNGKIELQNCQAELIQAASTNGSIKVEADGRDVKLQTTNGSIKYWSLAPEAGTIDLKSVNGSIKVYLEDVQNARFEATTRRGSVVVDPEWDRLSENKALSGKSVIASTQGYDPSLASLCITAKTTNGSIKLNDY